MRLCRATVRKKSKQQGIYRLEHHSSDPVLYGMIPRLKQAIVKSTYVTGEGIIEIQDRQTPKSKRVCERGNWGWSNSRDSATYLRVGKK